jgi:putative phosphoesterase|tara:strand:+ start:2758 stop:3246 length:489 start_codon:yes stop_codon:yes gene_type:complete
MKVGVVSDTHNNLKSCNKIVELFNEAEVDRVIHTGDITQAKTLEIFSGLNAPLWGVFGNNDIGERESLTSAVKQFGFEFIEPPLTLFWLEKKIVVVHDPLELSMVNACDYDIILHGHTHRKTIEYDGGQLTFNPGECAGHMDGYNAIGVLDLQELRVEILNF